MAEQPKKESLLETAAEFVRHEMNVKWLWIAGTMDVEAPDHECSPDCEHWSKENKCKE